MSIGKKCRHLWHDAYYKFATENGVEFAMRCQDVAEIVDLGTAPLSLIKKFRFHLHLSLCQACRNYFDLTRALKKAVGAMIASNSQEFVQNLNESLIKKYPSKD